METIDLKIDLRTRTGKGGARTLRREGKAPATLYGPKRSAANVSVDAKEFQTKVMAIEGSHLIRLQSESADINGRLALVKETQCDPVSGELLHTDLYEVDMKTKLRVRVPLHFVGRATGVELGGILQPIQREVEVSCLPTDIPEFLEVSVSHLGIHEAIHISELAAPAGVEVLFDSDDSIVTVLPPTVEEVKVAAPEEGEGVVAEAPAAAPKGEGGKASA